MTSHCDDALDRNWGVAMSINGYLKFMAACLSAIVAAPSLAQAGFVGHTIDAQILYPNTSTVYSDMGNTTVLGSGDTFNAYNSHFRIDFTDSTITIISKDSFAFANDPFDGFVFINKDGQIPIISSVVIDKATTQPGFSSAALSFDANHIFVNDSGLSGSANDKIVLDVTFNTSAAPEPAAWALMMVGVGGMGAALRTRRRKVVAV